MKSILSTLLVLASLILHAQNSKPTIVNAENGKLNLSKLKPGSHEYLVYYTDSTQQKRTNGDIWKRTTEFKKLNGKDVVYFTWRSFANGKFYRETVNICDAKTLSPIHHKTEIFPLGDERIDAAVGVYAYDFHKDKLVPSDSIANNKTKEKGAKQLTIPIISWEQDLETYPLLPIKKVGEVFEISFFDPNETETKYHQYIVSGKEILKLNEDTFVDCWVLVNRENSPNYSKFWLSEKSKQVLKMEQFFRGQYRFKVLQY